MVRSRPRSARARPSAASSFAFAFGAIGSSSVGSGSGSGAASSAAGAASSGAAAAAREEEDDEEEEFDDSEEEGDDSEEEGDDQDQDQDQDKKTDDRPLNKTPTIPGSRKNPDERRRTAREPAADLTAGTSAPLRSRSSNHIFGDGDKSNDWGGLRPQLVTQLCKPREEGGLGLARPTRVQSAVLPVALAGRDLLGRSETGSGKTLAYLLPIAHALLSRRVERSEGTLAVVLAPTRELAGQIVGVAQALLRPFPWLVTGAVTGGERRKSEKARLRRGVTLLVATPGRLLDHLEHTNAFNTGGVRWLVLDEADRLLDLGFEKQVREIVRLVGEGRARAASKARVRARAQGRVRPAAEAAAAEAAAAEGAPLQTLLLSATVTAGIRELAGMALRDPAWVNVDRGAASVAEAERELDLLQAEAETHFETPQQLAQQFIVAPRKNRPAVLAAFLRRELERGGVKAIVFMSSCDSVDFHHALFEAVDWPGAPDGDENLLGRAPVRRLHGNMPQKLRQTVWRDFAEARSGVLLCTDVAARGLDLPAVTWIVQFDAPSDTRDYVHRVGRTARRGRQGNSLLFLTPSEAAYVDVLASRGLQLTQLSLEATAQAAAAATDMHLSAKRAAHDSLASKLMYSFSNAVQEDRDLAQLARGGYQAFVRAYATYGKDVKHVFQVRSLHFGHVAKSFGLREPPTQISVRATESRHKAAKREVINQMRQKRKARSIPSSRKIRRLKSQLAEFVDE